MYLPEATVPLRSKSFSEEGGDIDPDEAEKGRCTHTVSKDWNKSYNTGAIRDRRLHNLLGRHHRANGEGIHRCVRDISKIEG